MVIEEGDKILFHQYYHGVDVVCRFSTTLKKVREKLIAKMHVIMPPTEKDIPYNPQICHICGQKFGEDEIKCLEHSHSSVAIRDPVISTID